MTNDNAVVLFFRGTEPAKLVEWWSDAHVRPCPALPCPALPCPALSYAIMQCSVLPFSALARPALMSTASMACHCCVYPACFQAEQLAISKLRVETSHPAQLCLQNKASMLLRI